MSKTGVGDNALVQTLSMHGSSILGTKEFHACLMLHHNEAVTTTCETISVGEGGSKRRVKRVQWRGQEYRKEGEEGANEGSAGKREAKKRRKNC